MGIAYLDSSAEEAKVLDAWLASRPPAQAL